MRACRFLCVVVLTGVWLPGCLPRDRLNLDCEWIEPDRQPLDVNNRSDQQHLHRDVDIAVELIFRNADAEHGRRYGYSAHGGYVDGGRFRDACRDKLFAAIADAHGLTVDQVRDTRAHLSRDWRIVLIASLPFGLFYYLVALVLCRMWMARFSADEQRLRFVALIITSAVASAAGVQLALLWFNIAEMLRVGNDHLGQVRAFPMSTPYLTTMFITGLMLFWFAALRQSLRGSQTPAVAVPHDLRLNS